MPLVHRLNPKIMKSTQLGPWPWAAAVPAKIRRARRGSWPGKVCDRLRGSPRLDLRARTGQGGWRRAHTVEQDGGDHDYPNFGEGVACPGQCAKAQASKGLRGDSRVAEGLRGRARTGIHQRRQWWSGREHVSEDGEPLLL
jgi:hypothetical protein